MPYLAMSLVLFAAKCMIKTLFHTNQPLIGATEYGGAVAVPRNSAGVSVLICFAITTFALALMLNGECSRPPSEYGIHSHLIEWMGSGGHYIWQSRGYFALLGSCALVVLSAPSYRNFLIEQYELRRLRFFVYFLALAAFVFKCFQNPGGMAFGFLCLPVLFLVLKQSQRLSKNVCLLLLSAFVGLMVVPGLLAVPDLTASDAGKLLEIQTHYSDVVGPGALLASGKPLFKEVDPFYGFIQPVLISVVGSRTGAFSFGTYVELVRVFQAVFIIIAAYLFYNLSGRPKVASLFAIAFFAPLMQLNQMSEYFPNQTAWRLLGFPLAMIALLACRSLSRLAMSYAFGVIATVLMLFNFETGLCITAGFLAFLYMREPHKGVDRLRHYAKVCAVFALGLLSSFICMYLVGWLMLGYAPDLFESMRLFKAKQLLVQSGYLGGGRLTFQPIPFLIVVHCLYTIVRLALDNGFPSGFRNSLRVATATMCLLWFTYFINRPAPGDQYLIGCYFLYSFLVIDLVRAAVVGVRRKSFAIEPAIVTCALLSLIIFPRITQQLKNATGVLKTTALEFMHGPAELPATLVSGVYLPQASAAELNEKAAFIKTASKSGPVYYLTASSFIIPCLSGVYSAAPVIDLFSCLAFESDTDKLVKRLNDESVSTILVDSSQTRLVGFKSWIDCFEDLRQRLSRYYSHTSTKDGWEIWTKAAAKEKS